MNESRPLRMGMIRAGHGHCGGVLKDLWANEDVEFVGAWEPDEPIVQALTQKYPQLTLVDRPERLLDDPDVDAIVLEGQNFQHYEWAIPALRAGKDLRIEKTVDVSAERIREIEQLAEQTGRVVQTGYSFLYNSGVRQMRQIAAAGLLGHVFQARGRLSLGLGSYDAPEFYLPENVGGTVFDETSNLLGALVPIMGAPQRATGLVARHHRPDRLHDDNGVLLFEFDRALATLESAHMEADCKTTRTLQLFGTEGTAIVEPLEPARLRLYLSEAGGGYEAGWQTITPPEESRHAAEIADFVHAIRTRTPPQADITDAADIVAALCAAYENARHVNAFPPRPS